MEQVVTRAVVLAAIDYSESSRIFRLLTPVGVQSALARNARASRRRFGTALDLFAEGTATFQVKPGRDLHTLTGFDVERARPALAADLDRFAAAAALGEVVARGIGEDVGDAGELAVAYELVVGTLDALARASGTAAHATAIAGLWRLVATLGFAPALDRCVECGEPVADDHEAVFAHAAGGVRCARCAAAGVAGRRLPAAARRTIRTWIAGETDAPDSTPAGPPALDAPTVRAHLRLLKEFLAHHLLDPRPLRAWGQWERLAAEGTAGPARPAPRAGAAPEPGPSPGV
jgi:DNA repair protein RecO (recombination protein O)